MFRRAAAPLALLVFALTGCLSSSSATTIGATPTLITADPSAFEGPLVCGVDFKRYVVTLTDVTTPQVLSSSAPTPCNQEASFGAPLIVIDPTGLGHFYTADVDAYDRDDITPLKTGTRDMVDSATGLPVAARWTTQCGQATIPDGGADDAGSAATPTNLLTLPFRAQNAYEVFIHGCAFLRTPSPDASVDAAAPELDASSDTDGSSTQPSEPSSSEASSGEPQNTDAGPTSSEGGS